MTDSLQGMAITIKIKQHPFPGPCVKKKDTSTRVHSGRGIEVSVHVSIEVGGA
jgi:hypothetical protein